MAPTARQVEIWRLHKDTCLGNGFGQTQFLHRHREGNLVSQPGFPNNTVYTTPDPRTQDNPNMDAALNVWMTWGPVRLKGGVDGGPGGDSRASKAWLFRNRGQCPAIDDNGNLIALHDDDFGIDPQGFRFRVENPGLTPDGSTWFFEIVRHR